MRKYIYIGCGSFMGAVLRYLIKNIQIQNNYESIPFNTLFINVLGAFLMAFLLMIVFEDATLRLGITTGILGAFTTFSTLCKEICSLMKDGDYYSAVLYMTASILLGLGAAYVGMLLAHEVNLKLLNKKEEIENIIEQEGDVD